MHLTYRAANTDDITGCCALVPVPIYALAPALRLALPQWWRHGLRDGTVHLTVVEDAERPPLTRLVAFGCSVFITDAFADAARRLLPPPVTAHLAALSETAASPILTAPQVRAANSGPGLTVLVPCIGWDTAALTDDEVRRVKARLIEAFFFAHAGYRVREFLQEVYSQSEMERGLVVGIIPYTDYAPFLPPDDNPDDRPYLTGITRDACRDGSAISPLFLYQPPRFGFRPGEQDVLKLALLDKSDDAIAQTLAVSPATIHKRWQAIHERVTLHAPGWFPLPPEGDDGPRVRGTEKRRHLLSYLRSHPEELRPYNPPRPPAQNKAPEAKHRTLAEH